MGRSHSGCLSTINARKIEIKNFIRAGALKKGQCIEGELMIGDTFKMSFIADLKDRKGFLRVKYQLRDKSGYKKEYDYFIDIAFTPSNLGRGDILHFVCPILGIKTKTLYMAYGSPKWQHRDAFLWSIYYPCQTYSKLNYHNERYWELDSKLGKIKAKRSKKYKGVLTKNEIRSKNLLDKISHHENERWIIIANSLFKKLKLI
jgi:hypothetical protein